jgi:hypothetical protein
VLHSWEFSVEYALLYGLAKTGKSKPRDPVSVNFPAQHLLFCLCCQLAGCTSAEPVTTAPVPLVVHTQEALRAALASGMPTPLDALTPYGKREVIRKIRWNENGLAGFGSTPLIRELGHGQLAAVLSFLDASAYLPMLEKKLVGPPLRLSALSSQTEQDLQRLRQFAEADATQRAAASASISASATEIGAPAVLQRYHQLFGNRLNPAMLSAEQSGNLVALFDAASLAAQDNPASSATDDMLQLHHELTARAINTRRTLDDAMLYALLAARRFAKARTFAAMHPDLTAIAIPQVVDSLGPAFAGRSAFAYDAKHNTLTRVAIPGRSGTELVMVVGAGCHHSANALQALQADPELQRRLRQVHLLLVTAPNAPIETRLISEWNAANPSMPIHAPYSAAEWNGIDVTGIPSFYLLRNGKVVDRHTGWSDKGKADLLKLIGAAK